MGNACAREENRETTYERRRRREEELNIPPRASAGLGSRRVTPRRHARAASYAAPPYYPIHPVPAPTLMPAYPQLTQMIPAHPYAQPPPFEHQQQQSRPPSRGRAKSNRKHRHQPNGDVPGAGGLEPYSFGGGSLDPRTETLHHLGTRGESRGPKRTGSYKELRPQIIQALGLIETEEIQQRMDIVSEEREAGLSIVMMFEWLPEACSIQDKLREIVDLELTSRISILRQEHTAFNAFYAWVRELLDDARLSMLVSNTLHRQHIPSPQRIRSPYRAASGLGPGTDVNHDRVSRDSYPHYYDRASTSMQPSSRTTPTSRPTLEKREEVKIELASSRAWRIGESILKGRGDSSSYYGAGEDAIGTRLSSNLGGGSMEGLAPTPTAGFNEPRLSSPGVRVASERNDGADGYLESSHVGDPRFLCFHPSHSHEMRQRRAASEERALRSRLEHEEISRLAAQGTLMYGREEEELRQKIARQQALAEGLTSISASGPKKDARKAPSRAPPPPPLSSPNGLNSPPRGEEAYGRESDTVPWFQQASNSNVKPHPVGALYNHSSNPNDYSYVPHAGDRSLPSSRADYYPHWRDARDASVRATESRLKALSR